MVLATPKAARAAGLRYSDDDRPGWSRRRAGRGFLYRDDAGRPITDPEALGRIRSLAIPPAWTDVWICPDPLGCLQATGRDAKGRKQYLYHDEWRAHAERTKFDRMAEFGRALRRIRLRVRRDLARRGLDRDRVTAAVVALLEQSWIRIGNREYAIQNGSHGLTTLANEEAQAGAERIRFSFVGKSGKRHEVSVRDRRLARLVRRCQELPGQTLFQYVGEDGEPRDVTSDEVNDYLRRAAGSEFSAKDFRTWCASAEFLRLARESGHPTRSETRRLVQCVAHRLGNTPAVCRRSYLHPAVVAAWEAGEGWPPDLPADADQALLALLEPARQTSVGRVSRASRSAPRNRA